MPGAAHDPQGEGSCVLPSLISSLTSEQVHAAFTWNLLFLRIGAFAMGLKCTLTATLTFRQHSNPRENKETQQRSAGGNSSERLRRKL